MIQLIGLTSYLSWIKRFHFYFNELALNPWNWTDKLVSHPFIQHPSKRRYHPSCQSISRGIVWFFFFKSKNKNVQEHSFHTLLVRLNQSGHFDKKEVALTTFGPPPPKLVWKLWSSKKIKISCIIFNDPLTCLFFFCLLLPFIYFINLHVHPKPPCYFKREFCL